MMIDDSGQSGQKTMVRERETRVKKERERDGLTVVRHDKVGRRLEEAVEKSGMNLLHGQVLNAVRVPVHVVTNSLPKKR